MKKKAHKIVKPHQNSFDQSTKIQEDKEWIKGEIKYKKKRTNRIDQMNWLKSLIRY